MCKIPQTQLLKIVRSILHFFCLKIGLNDGEKSDSLIYLPGSTNIGLGVPCTCLKKPYIFLGSLPRN